MLRGSYALPQVFVNECKISEFDTFVTLFLDGLDGSPTLEN